MGRKEFTMKKTNDYTLGGRLSCTTWNGFIAECKSRGIETTGKKFAELEAEMLKALDAEVAQETATEVAAPADIDIHNFQVDNAHGDAIVTRIVLGGKDRNGKSHGPAVYTATKSQDPESQGKLMVTAKRLFAIVGDVYGVSKDDPQGEATIKGAIRTLCKYGYLNYKKYDSDHVAFFPTERMVYKAIQVAHMPKH